MPIIKANLDHWFTYHPPTDDTGPKYATILAAEQECQALVHRIAGGAISGVSGFAEVTTTVRAFADLCLDLVPGSADLSAAIRCIRLARNACNECLALSERNESYSIWLIDIARAEFTKARWQANAAIACEGR